MTVNIHREDSRMNVYRIIITHPPPLGGDDSVNIVSLMRMVVMTACPITHPAVKVDSVRMLANNPEEQKKCRQIGDCSCLVLNKQI